ncbi:DUF433 domain-containing protein [candidate division CSSED10-310 bacterium]|uniref:DUF433 domain-containing protein n=1 Tax=candidate division CSSED10-310 bacterium TaxID=2855610 RepID=A0ABV6Z0I8_UNCC1
MKTKTLDQHIEISPETLGGKPRIAGRRIAVQDIVVWHEILGTSVDEIASEYDLTLADVYAALAYYHDHREEIDISIQQGEEFIKQLRNKFPSKISQKLNEPKD